MEDESRFSVFVSHSFDEKDPELASKLSIHLKSHQITAYLAEDEKLYGRILSNKIRKAISDSRCVVIIWTKNSVLSPSVNQELGFAMGIEKMIIPMVSSDIKNNLGVLAKDVEFEIFNNDNFEEKCVDIARHISQLPMAPSESYLFKTSEELFKEERSDF